MTTRIRPLAIVIESDFGMLSTAVRTAAEARYQVIGRLSPRGVTDLVTTLRPELVLLGVPFWDQGWGSLFRTESPETLVFPLDELRLGRLPQLLSARPAEVA
jgi:hypothetical protein